MKRIIQEDASGCGVAALAMLLDLPYAGAREFAEAVLGDRNWASQGLHREELDRCLLHRGCELEHRRRHEGGSWPPAPFAPRHYAYAEMHFVVVGADGVVFDTYPRDRQEMTLAGWEDVRVVVGVRLRPGRVMYDHMDAQTEEDARRAAVQAPSHAGHRDGGRDQDLHRQARERHQASTRRG